MKTKEAKYNYCLNENGELVHIDSVKDETRHSHRWYCLGCGQEMIPNLCKKKISYFSHKADTACDGETYLHKLAKIRIREKFNKCINFPIKFHRTVPCSESKQCVCFDEQRCMERATFIPSDLKLWDGREVYDTCQEEVSYGDFRPDLLLTCSKIPNRQPVFIEVVVTHKSTEEKINSGYKIIETNEIKSEKDINDIIQNGFIEGTNCTTRNFTPQSPNLKWGDTPFHRFVLFQSGGVKVDDIYCMDKDKKRAPYSIIELNMKYYNWPFEQHVIPDSYKRGLVYLWKRNVKIKNCLICKYRMISSSYPHQYVCVMYRRFGLEITEPRQSSAKTCPYFLPEDKLLDIPFSELENEIEVIKETPIDKVLFTNKRIQDLFYKEEKS